MPDMNDNRRNLARAFNHLERVGEYLEAILSEVKKRDDYYAAQKKAAEEQGETFEYDDTPSFVAEFDAALNALAQINAFIVAIAGVWWDWDRDDLLRKTQQ